MIYKTGYTCSLLIADYDMPNCVYTCSVLTADYDLPNCLYTCSLLTADYAAIAVLISLGAVMGKLNPIQIFMMASNEVVFFAVNQFLGVGLFRVRKLIKTRLRLKM